MESKKGKNIMEVYAKSKFDYEAIKELAHRSSYRLIPPKIYWIIMIACTVVVFVVSLPFGIDSHDVGAMFAILMCDVVSIYIYWGVPKMRFKALGKLQNLENEFIFGDETMKIINKSEEYTG